MFDIPATVNSLPSAAGSADGGALPPQAIQLLNDYGERGYGGPCPAKGHGAHHYVLTVHALRVPVLGAGPEDAPAAVECAILREEIGKAVLGGGSRKSSSGGLIGGLVRGVLGGLFK